MDPLRQVLQSVQIMADIMESTLDVRVDFTPASLRRIEKAINRVYPLGHEPMTSTIVSYGIYLGEVFARNIPRTEWGTYSEDFLSWHFRSTGESQVFIGYPLKRVHDFWFDRSRGLSAFYHMNVDALEGRLDLEVSEEWKLKEGEYMYRFPASVRIDTKKKSGG
ncbi:hypothetical protein [Paenibacillus gansuensis]|uniref:Uncharacterized protein n=1 Tax=Paenibacillus gansuensis TaxID=306542 RepID=A0ABW5PJN3_9BACL